MNNATRELLLNTNAARAWGEEHFHDHVNDLMVIAGKVDTPARLAQCTELLDVYQHSLSRADTCADKEQARPFAFRAFRN